MEAITLSELIKQFREINHLTQQEFADRCGLSKGYISMLEKGKHPQRDHPVAPSLACFKKISAGMGIPLQQLFQILDVQDWVDSGFEFVPASDPADRELLDILEELRSREDMRMLFKLARGASPDDVRRAAAIIEALRKQD